MYSLSEDKYLSKEFNLTKQICLSAEGAVRGATFCRTQKTSSSNTSVLPGVNMCAYGNTQCYFSLLPGISSVDVERQDDTQGYGK